MVTTIGNEDLASSKDGSSTADKSGSTTVSKNTDSTTGDSTVKDGSTTAKPTVPAGGDSSKTD